MYQIPNEVTKENFFEFIEGHFKNCVSEFNGACGKNPYAVTDVDVAVDMVINEAKRVAEEAEESVQGWKERNRQERLDGVVDTYWTRSQLDTCINVFTEKFGKDFHTSLKLRAYDDILMITYASELSKIAITVAQGTIISAHAVMVAALRVAKNNSMKYTTDKSVADDWASNIPKEYVGKHMLKGYEYNGVTYYCIKRLEDDYIVKPYNFKPVDLGDL